MTFCGFNSQIDQGIRAIAAGMEEAIARRAALAGISVREAVVHEIDELTYLDQHFLAGSEHPYFLLFRSLNTFAMHYFRQLLHGIDTGHDYITVSQMIVDRFVAGLETIDTMHESYRASSPEPMCSIAALVKWLSLEAISSGVFAPSNQGAAHVYGD